MCGGYFKFTDRVVVYFLLVIIDKNTMLLSKERTGYT